MYKYSKFHTVFLFSIMSFLANAGETINYNKSLPTNAPGDATSNIVLNLYVTEDDTVPVATQTYLPGEWQLNKSKGTSTLQVTMEDVSYLDEYLDLWAETEIDGIVVGPRELILVTEPGLSAGGLIESRTEGFKFPDTTVQITAGATPGDLSSHAGNASSHHSPAVSTTEIVDGTIAPIDVSQDGNFTIGGLTVDGSSHTYFKSDADIRIHDDVNAFRWYDATGTTQHAYIIVSSDAVSFVDTNRGYTIFNSNNQGIGIGGAAPTSSHSVTMPSLNVTGNLEIGLERVFTGYNTSTSTIYCDEYDGGDCFYGSGMAMCPVGTKILGGGLTGGSPGDSGIADSYPEGDDYWWCSSRDSSAAALHYCYAICARLE